MTCKHCIHYLKGKCRYKVISGFFQKVKPSDSCCMIEPKQVVAKAKTNY